MFIFNVHKHLASCSVDRAEIEKFDEFDRVAGTSVVHLQSQANAVRYSY